MLKIKKLLYMYLTNVKFRVNFSLNITLILNALYSVFQLFLGIRYGSVWNTSFSAYYMMLALMRFYLLRYTKDHQPCEDMKKELQIYRFCAVVLLLLNVILSVIVFYITWQNKGFLHNNLTTVVITIYTTVSIVISINNLVKYRKYKSPALNAVKIIGVTSSAVSLLTLETALFEEQNKTRQIIAATTGFVVISFVLATAVYMIIFASKKLKTVSEK